MDPTSYLHVMLIIIIEKGKGDLLTASSNKYSEPYRGINIISPKPSCQQSLHSCRSRTHHASNKSILVVLQQYWYILPLFSNINYFGIQNLSLNISYFKINMDPVILIVYCF